ncbi:MAG: DUF4465 domain-containing protein [Okeania sp. SIO2G4]|uniref:DUF4465 domain-containing protein n=1 Tax=unclassified Okeania TaxID=2634635 RepID=UPI0013B8D28C|nr:MULTISPECIES: DUF4465 domain-containing protein [unclassified Okeania]NEP06841.1 DUF4465 domain-containing protein [Okeania sp. SIO4D6]NEP45054.1 DUF4465 domain-containing protein [Okeania sp. SIO2H7]NEP75850.1 DUF4465 domain-containing protein [Okeania sp. SIO2G5]NEP96555.1 DUF4465 domain-containing protein [Okeania sp. SIO2F5]NEQ94676.1 DUF4465 domain-containing protein [Okeania sp. SIO2G4]
MEIKFAKKFGGVSGNNPDFFLLTINGLDDSSTLVGSVEFYLADYRFADNSQDFIVGDWSLVDLSPLNAATKLSFALASSDNDPQFGLNTPPYFALDNLILHKSVPESASNLGLLVFGAVGVGSMLKHK